MKFLVPSMLVVVGIIHLLPLSGVPGGERLAALYGLPVDEPNLQILMRHRAVLFGLLGAFLIAAAIKPAFRTAAFVGGFVSVVAFLALAGSVGNHNAAIGRVVVADWVALACLTVGAVVHAMRRA